MNRDDSFERSHSSGDDCISAPEHFIRRWGDDFTAFGVRDDAADVHLDIDRKRTTKWIAVLCVDTALMLGFCSPDALDCVQLGYGIHLDSFAHWESPPARECLVEHSGRHDVHTTQSETFPSCQCQAVSTGGQRTCSCVSSQTPPRH
jgi:hypothetical protein